MALNFIVSTMLSSFLLHYFSQRSLSTVLYSVPYNDLPLGKGILSLNGRSCPDTVSTFQNLVYFPPFFLLFIPINVFFSKEIKGFPCCLWST